MVTRTIHDDDLLLLLLLLLLLHRDHSFMRRSCATAHG
jgi:hypothetical protein